MYLLNAMTARFAAVEILEVPGLFTTERVNRSTVPKGMYLYEMQTSEQDWGHPCLLGRHISEAHFGTVLTASPIDLPERDCRDLFPGDFTGHGGTGHLTVAEFEDKYLGRHPPGGQSRPHKIRTAAPAR